jgi:hypothetical protein
MGLELAALSLNSGCLGLAYIVIHFGLAGGLLSIFGSTESGNMEEYYDTHGLVNWVNCRQRRSSMIEK